MSKYAFYKTIFAPTNSWEFGVHQINSELDSKWSLVSIDYICPTASYPDKEQPAYSWILRATNN